jgi:hypothetical protein
MVWSIERNQRHDNMRSSLLFPETAMKRTWALSFLFILAGIGSYANAQTCGVLRSGESLAPDQVLHTCNGAGRLVHQLDGNVVVYGPAGVVWASDTKGPSRTLVM